MTEWKSIEAHLGEAHSKLGAARCLLKEGYYRDATSRAYYAEYHAAKAILLSRDIRPKTHVGVINQFGLHFIKSGYLDKMLASAIATGKEARETGDYDIFIEFTKERAEMTMSDAENFVDRVENAIERIKREEGNKKREDE